MKTLKKMLIAGIIIMFFGACSDDPSDQIVPIPHKSRPLHIEAEKTGKPLTLQERMTFDFEELASICNLTSSADVHLQIMISRSLESGKFLAEPSHFNIVAPETGCSLDGNFSGVAFNDMQGIKVVGSVVVTKGTGGFEADSGNLQLTLTGILVPEKVQEMDFTLEVDGYLK